MLRKQLLKPAQQVHPETTKSYRFTSIILNESITISFSMGATVNERNPSATVPDTMLHKTSVMCKITWFSGNG